MARATGLFALRQCSSCKQLFLTIHRKYFGKLFCTSCYWYFFPKLICITCHQSKRIYRNEQVQVCQQCLISNEPCYRCNKSNYKIGKITQRGPLCKSCARHVSETKCCFRCSTKTKWMFRYLRFGEKEPICFKCLKAAHFKRCHHCREIKAPYFSSLDGLNLCKACLNDPFKLCRVCQIKIPSGAFGHKCQDCFAKATLIKRVELNKVRFTPQIAGLYQRYANWLSVRCGAAKASRQILRDIHVFVFFDDYKRKKNTFPTYKIYRKELTIVQKRQYILAQKFFFEINFFATLYPEILAESNKSSIRRIINGYKTNTCSLSEYLLGYYGHLLNKYRKGYTSIRSIRLSLTPASQLLQLARKKKQTTVEQELVNQYLWFHLGQRAALTGFINYLNKSKNIDITIKPAVYFVLQRTKETKRRLRLQLLDNIRQEGRFSARYIELAFAYYHDRSLPLELLHIDLYLECKHDSGMIIINLAKQSYTIPILS